MTETESNTTDAVAGPQDFAPCAIPLREMDSPGNGEVHVWYLDLQKLGRSLQGALGGGSEPVGMVAFTSGQLRFARRFYLRLLLGAYLGVPGKSVKINRSNRGKPVLDRAVHDADLHFSMAKSGDRLLIGFASRRHIGVDLEPSQRRARNALGVARRYFSSAEAAALASMSPAVMHRAFLRTWACKEAVVKASGAGIANQLCLFTVETDLSKPVGVLEFDGKGGDWSLGLVQPETGYLGAIAVRDSTMKIRALRLLPARISAG